MFYEPGMVAHIYNPNTWAAEVEGLPQVRSLVYVVSLRLAWIHNDMLSQKKVIWGVIPKGKFSEHRT